MAFNFNWSPLIADTSRAREMLTAALNKSPKPPIIVDDIIVTELNLGAVPPELEILEIGDLAEDRFRGIFKMTYSGDAFLTLKTRVQANPLNTYLSTKPSFASPQPLAAADGLTIPLQITLSDIRLSGFVILVFSRHKGLTLVFRNDPLESLKVSSTFDSIPFVRDYLQKEIEKQLRVLFMEDLPAILHRLSLRLWSPEYREMDEKVLNTKSNSGTSTPAPVDPFASPPQYPIDAYGNPLDESQISDLSLDPQAEIHASFSQKNLLRLAALNDSNRTLSLFTPSIRDAVFRAWAGSAERAEPSAPHISPLTQSSLSRVHFAGSTTPSTLSVSEGTDDGSISSRPTYSSSNSTYNSLGLGGGRSRAHAQRKRKRRIVNLRKDKTVADDASTTTEMPESSLEASVSSSVIDEEREEDLVTPPQSPPQEFGKQTRRNSIEKAPVTSTSSKLQEVQQTPETEQPASRPALTHASTSSVPIRPHLRDVKKPFSHAHSYTSPSSSSGRLQASALPYGEMPASGSILEQAWMMKMATEIARKVRDEKEREARGAGSSDSGSFWDRRMEDEMDAPPAYTAA
ncbi:mitochondrial distribution and morphology protein 34 [Phyllosticta capitalensis]